MGKEHVFISVDIEATGNTTGNYSMIAVGAVVVGEHEKQFYAELRPLPEFSWRDESMRVGCLELDCLKPYTDDCYNPRSNRFQPQKTIELLQRVAGDPAQEIGRLVLWVAETAGSRKPIFFANPTSFDPPQIYYYTQRFTNYLLQPWKDISSMFAGFTNNPVDATQSLKHAYRQHKNPRMHHALSDAIYQAQLLESLLADMHAEKEQISRLKELVKGL